MAQSKWISLARQAVSRTGQDSQRISNNHSFCVAALMHTTAAPTKHNATKRLMDRVPAALQRLLEFGDEQSQAFARIRDKERRMPPAFLIQVDNYLNKVYNMDCSQLNRYLVGAVRSVNDLQPYSSNPAAMSTRMAGTTVEGTFITMETLDDVLVDVIPSTHPIPSLQLVPPGEELSESGLRSAALELLELTAPMPTRSAHLLGFLSRTSTHGYEVTTKAALIAAIHMVGKRIGRGVLPQTYSRAILDIFLHTSGIELTLLKDAINVAGSIVDLHQLVYRDLLINHRYELLQKIAVEASSLSPRIACQVFTDFDDTVQAMWVDERYSRGITYPGVLSFMHELRVSDLSGWEPGRPPLHEDAEVVSPPAEPASIIDAGSEQLAADTAASHSSIGAHLKDATRLAIDAVIMGIGKSVPGDTSPILPPIPESLKAAHAASSQGRCRATPVLHPGWGDALAAGSHLHFYMTANGGPPRVPATSVRIDDVDSGPAGGDATSHSTLIKSHELHPSRSLTHAHPSLSSTHSGVAETVSFANRWVQRVKGWQRQFRSGVSITTSTTHHDTVIHGSGPTSGQTHGESSQQATVLGTADDLSHEVSTADALLGRLESLAPSEGTSAASDVADSADARAPPPTLPSSIVVVTARPADYRGYMKRKTLERLKDLQLGHVIVLLGALFKSASTAAIVAKKVENMGQYKCLFPEYGFVFLGDSGQGDAAVASVLLREYPQHMVACFINDVEPESAVTGDGGTKEAYKQAGVTFSTSYVAASQHAAALQLLHKEAAMRVRTAAARETRILSARGLRIDTTLASELGSEELK